MRALVLLLAPALVIGAMSWPLLFTDAAFNEDWVHHLWYTWNQSLAIRENLHPSFFINYSYSVFYPEYAFYGGTLYAIVGSFSLALGDAPLVAYVASYLVGFLVAYAGWYRLARMAQIGRWWAPLPGLVFVTSSYYITLVYARGDLQEFLAISILPPLLASGLTILRAGRLSLASAFVFAVSAIVFFGSHNLTILWGSTLFALMSALVLIFIPSVRPWVSRRSLLCLAAIAVPALLVNAWFLLPAVAYESRTLIAHETAHWETLLREFVYIIPVRNLFTVTRRSVAPDTDFSLALPVLAMAWSLAAVAVYRWGRGRGAHTGDWLRLFLISAALIAAITVLMTHAGIVLALPWPYTILQFGYRLESYIMLLTSAAVLAGLALAQSSSARRQLWRWALVAVVIFSVVGAIGQASDYPRAIPTRAGVVGGVAHANISLTGQGDYLDASLPSLQDPYGAPIVRFPPTAVHDERVSRVVHLQPHQWVYTNIGGGPELVHVSGARIVGRETGGHDVLEIGQSTGARRHGGREARPTEVITVSAANGTIVVLGRVLSLVGIVSLLGVFAVLLVRYRRAARRSAMLSCMSSIEAASWW